MDTSKELDELLAKRIFKYTINDIHEVTGRSVHTIRDDKERGNFRPYDFKSTIQYILRVGIKGVEID